MTILWNRCFYFLGFSLFHFHFSSLFFWSSRVCSQLVSCTPLRFAQDEKVLDGCRHLKDILMAGEHIIACLRGVMRRAWRPAWCLSGARAPRGGRRQAGQPAALGAAPAVRPGRVRRGNALRLAKNNKISSKILILVGHRFDSKKTCSAGFFGIESITLLEKLVEATSFFKKFQLR